MLKRARLRALTSWCFCMILASCQINQTQDGSANQATERLPVKSAESVPEYQSAPRDELTSEHAITYLSLWERIRASLPLQPAYSHPRVLEQAARYAGNQEYFDLIAERAAPFLHGIVSEVESRGLPMEIALLPFVESAFSPDARSREGAVGLWQFSPAPPALMACNKIGGMTAGETPGPQLRQRWTTYNPSTTSSIRTGLLRSLPTTLAAETSDAHCDARVSRSKKPTFGNYPSMQKQARMFRACLHWPV